MARRIIPLEHRFWDKVSFPDDPNDCWIWAGAIDPETGYGRIGVGPRGTGTIAAHRLSHEINIGPLRERRDACHTCNNRACVNPLHLYEGTRKENMEQAQREGRLKRAFKPWSEERRAAFQARQLTK